MLTGGLKHHLVGGGWIDGSWGSSGTVPGDPEPPVAQGSLYKRHESTGAVWDLCRSQGRLHR